MTSVYFWHTADVAKAAKNGLRFLKAVFYFLFLNYYLCYLDIFYSMQRNIDKGRTVHSYRGMFCVAHHIHFLMVDYLLAQLPLALRNLLY